ncbi:MAG: proprotein convertase P-domain-containing protein [Pirellulaceae bacterium]|nr:proprotein convertase P-domain-containing protein [Pirellulaceae bacterium]
MSRCLTFLRWSFLCAAALLGNSFLSDQLLAQAGLREALERLDKNEDGEISPDEITPLARPYLERITRERGMSVDRTNKIDKLQEAARVYYALRNGVAGKDVSPEGESSVKPFGPEPDQPLVPDFGLPEVKYPYIQADLDEADRTLRRSDRNEDGYIDRAEAIKADWTHRNPFEMDLDKDDRLSRLELGQRYARRRLLSRASGELRKKAWRTGSGIRPSRPEEEEKRDDSRWWRRGGSRYWLTATILGRFDANKNGRLESQEAQSLGIPLGQIDVDRDGELSRDELHSYLTEMQDEAGDLSEGLPGWFYELDANRDGQVAMAEFTTDWTDEKFQEFTLFDKNGDGLLTASEASQSKAMVGGSYSNQNAEVLPPRKTIISEIEVTDDYLIGDLNVRLSITHTHTSYLDAYLTGPDGQRIELFTEVGGEGDHFDETILDDQGRYPIVKARPPFKGTFLPEALIKKQPSLSHFNGKSVKGVWQLVVRCTRSERFGMLHNWGLIVRPEEGMLGSTMAVPSQEDSESSAVPAPGESARPASDEKSDSKLKLFGAQIIKRGDKNGDGVLTIDEYAEKDRQRFGSTDTNNDGRVDASELGAAMKRLQGAKPE